jgi:hypothetical protein
MELAVVFATVQPIRTDVVAEGTVYVVTGDVPTEALV